METTSSETIARAISDKASGQIERVAAGAQQAVGEATDAALVASRRLGVAGAQLASAADRWTEATREYVRRNPFASLGVAVGLAVGVALGAEFFYKHRGERSAERRHPH